MPSKPTCYKSADEAMIVSILANAGRLIAVDASLTQNGEGYMICDQHEPGKIWAADGTPWQTRVFCTAFPRLPAPGEAGLRGQAKYKLAFEAYGTEHS